MKPYYSEDEICPVCKFPIEYTDDSNTPFCGCPTQCPCGCENNPKYCVYSATRLIKKPQKLSDEQIAELGTERDPKMIPCGCSENTSKYACERFGCLRETL
jgi:hypothetical protein